MELNFNITEKIIEDAKKEILAKNEVFKEIIKPECKENINC